MTKKDWKISIVGAILGVIATTISDYFKSVPIFTTLKNFFIWLWSEVLTKEIPIWLILGLLFLSYLCLKAIKKFKKVKLPEWRSYTKDNFFHIPWEWEWKYNYQSQAWNAKRIRPICTQCGTEMQIINHINDHRFAKCPRCDHFFVKEKEVHEIEALILDNVKRGLYKK